MVFKNTTSDIGDVLYISTDVPILGITALSAFLDSTVGENPNTYFNRQFQYSLDGITWSAWISLTNANLAAIEIPPVGSTFYIQYSYTEAGLTNGLLTFNYIDLEGDFSAPEDGPVYESSSFANFFIMNNVCSIAWSINVLEKLYKQGQLPKAMIRNQSGNGTDDKDFIDIWRSITHFFALFVCLARYFQYFYQDIRLLSEFLQERDLIVNNFTQIDDMVYLMTYFIDEIRQRGTRQIFKPKGTTYEGSSLIKAVDGEYLRLINYQVIDEFIANLNKNEHIGWNLRNSSPCYKGLEGRLNCNKYYCDYIEDCELSQLSILSASLPYVSKVVDHTISDDDPEESISASGSYSESYSLSESQRGGEIVLRLHPPGVGKSIGIGGSTGRIVVNPNMDYEVIFRIRTTGSTLPTFTFGVNSFDLNNNPTNSFIINKPGSVSNIFCKQSTLNKGQQYYFVRGILYNCNTYREYIPDLSYNPGIIVYSGGYYYRAKLIVPTYTTPALNPDYWVLLPKDAITNMFPLNTGRGQNLLLDEATQQIDPFINYDQKNATSDSLYVYDIRVQPLRTEYSKGFLDITNILEIWNVNQNLALSEQTVVNKTRKFLIPANVVLIENFLDDVFEENSVSQSESLSLRTGSGAAATLSISGGVIVGIGILSGGLGYGSGTKVIIFDPGGGGVGGGSGAIATPIIGINGSIIGINIVNGGVGYHITTTTVTITG